MILNNILDSIYIIPAILDHMDNPTPATTKIMVLNDIGKEDFEYLVKIRHLLEYHRNVVQSGFEPSYPLLRKGLAEYQEECLYRFFIELNLYGKEITMLDYGCGDGKMMEIFKRMNPKSHAYGIDKTESHDASIRQIDWEKTPNWWGEYKENFDLVLLSEVLHCKDKTGQNYLIRSAYSMIKPGGNLLIIENDDVCMEYRINKLKSNNIYKTVRAFDISRMTSGLKLFLTKTYTINRHTAYLYEKL